METSITLLLARVIRASSVITLTEGVYVDAHDYRAPALRRIATRAVARLCKPATSERIARGAAFGVLPLTHRQKPGSTLVGTS
jgi:DNA-binding LytR/AlgR family response regulator